MQPDIIVPLAFFLMIVTLALGIPLVRAYSRRSERRPQEGPMSSEAAARLERMERGIEAMAIEIERISEGQRFLTKLLSERQVEALPGGGDAGRRR